MRTFLVFAVLTLIWSQGLQAEDTTDVLTTYHNRSLADIRSNIKNAANHAWEYLRTVANSKGQKISDWIQKIKILAQDVRKEFEKRLKEMKGRLDEMIQNLVYTGEVVKKCLEKRKQAIDEILKYISLYVANCLANNATNLNILAAKQYEPVPNKTEFLKKIEDDLNLCLAKDKTNEEECFYNIRKGIYEYLEKTEDEILQNHIETRRATDDLVATIISCSTDGVIKASAVIANETLQIIECVSQGYL